MRRKRFDTVVTDVNINIKIEDDIYGLVTVVSNELHHCAVLRKNNAGNILVRSEYLRKWELLLQEKDDDRFCQAIDMRGNFNVSVNGGEKPPSNEELKAHFEGTHIT